jgi:hypothetical protein
MEILDILAFDTDVEVRGEVARRRKLSRDLFWILAKDPELTVRAGIVGNAKVPIDVLEYLMNFDEDDWIRAEAHEELKKRALRADIKGPAHS